MNKFFTIAKKEFTKSIKKVSFWIFTFWIPLLYIIIFWVVYFSNMQREETLQQKNDIIKNIYVYDESWIIKDKDNKINKNIVVKILFKNINYYLKNLLKITFKAIFIAFREDCHFHKE